MMSEASRQCYICLDEEGEEGNWVSPCKCAGSLKWVHQSCLMRWVREHEAIQPWSPVACPQCRTRLRLMPEKGVLVTVLEFIDTTVYPAGKYIASWLFGLVAFDVSCTTFGILAQSQVYGLEETLASVSEADMLESLMKLHFTTISLVFINSCSWERYLLRGLQSLSRIPGGKWFLPEYVPLRFRFQEESPLPRVLVSSALLPFFARVVGNLFFSSVDSKLDRVLLGGLTFLGVKGVLYMYLLQQQEVRRKRMTITPQRTSVGPTISE